METTRKTPQTDKSHLATLINTYDLLIDKNVRCFNALSFGKVSIFVTGKNSIRKDFNEMFHLGLDLPVPADLLKLFFEQYGQLLIAERAKLIMEFEGLDMTREQFTASVNEIMKKAIDLEDPKLQRAAPPLTEIEKRVFSQDKILDNAEFFCPVCVKETDHHLHHYGQVIHWQCDCCSNINTNAEVD